MAETDTTTEPTTDPAGDPPAPEPVADPPATGEDALPDPVKEVLRKERENTRNAEKRAKAAERERDELRTAQMSETERAIAEAEAKGRESALSEVGRDLAVATFRAEAAGKIANVDNIVDLIDVSSLVGEDGRPDKDAISAAVEKFAALAPARPGFGPVDAGARGGEKPAKYTRSQLKDPKFFRENRDDILRAQREGRITSD